MKGRKFCINCSRWVAKRNYDILRGWCRYCMEKFDYEKIKGDKK